YWKDEGKEWDSNTPEEELWVYNCKDCVVTYEVSDVLDAQIDHLQLRDQYNFQMKMFRHALYAMLRGVRINKELRATVAMELSEAGSQYEAWFQNLIGPDVHEPPKSKTAKPWYRSPQQQVKLFYDELGIKPVTNRKTGRPTADDDALKKIGKREPVLSPLTDALANYRSIGVLYSTFIKAPLDPDGRVRCSYNVAGTDTFRFSSSKNAFGGGMNLQNITSGEELEDFKNKLHFQLPNLRKLFIPDRGYTLMATDLDRADLYVVVWEADDDELKQMLREGVNIHVENAKTIFPGTDCSPSKLASSSYHKAKQGVHATNYGCKARTLAAELGITIREAEDFIKRWLSAHPGIRQWHRRVEESLATTRSVSNAFGYRIRFFERIESLLPEALAWIPQSTVALIINKGWDNIEENLPWVQVLLQVHDELVLQVPKDMLHKRDEIEQQMLITVPYEHPLVIPVGATAGPSWGECKDIDWK
nr:hypothetical protein [Deltaproteobacteria bacterium]